ncbi:MAG: hypothetical protein IJB24_03745 [Clostridia bacterium]|nr:hypothetical protein [Clostridia bacterium]MBQ4601954.1 hypothetical protein [Clostridia bacterium]
MDKTIVELIDSTIKYVWEYEISNDYDNWWLLKEDSLKNALYYHIRSKLEKVFEDHNIRIFTEFTDDVFKGTGYRPDMVIATVDEECEEKHLGKCIKECLCVIELKHKWGYSSHNDILSDFEKIKEYIENPNINCNRYYMATIWEYKDKPVTWARKNAAWAKGKLTELNASYCGANGEIEFYTYKH